VQAQISSTIVPPVETPRRSSGSPKRKRPVLAAKAINVPTINSLPGKKAASYFQPTLLRESNKCSVCNVIFRSKADKEHMKKYGIKASWMGCDEDECSFWAHANCANIKIVRRKDIAIQKNATSPAQATKLVL
jgi:hypothetical protein